MIRSVFYRNTSILRQQTRVVSGAFVLKVPNSAPSISIISRNFSVSPVDYGKKKSGGKSKGNAASEEPAKSHAEISEVVDLADLKTKFQASVESFKERTAVIRQGKITPAVIEEITVTTHNHTEEPLRNIARVALKGPRAMTVTVFDPKNVKHITAAVIASGLNLNPQPDPKSPEQILRLPLPPTTSETKKEIIKDLKHEFEHFRNSPAKKSLTAVREDALKHVKKAGKSLSKDQVFEAKNDIEELFKSGAKNLADALKQAEAATMKD